jgi:hypothetical protein
MDLTDIYRVISFNNTTIYILLAAHGTFSKTDHILGHKTNLSKNKKIEIFSCSLFDHNALKLELNNKSNSRKHANKWRQSSTLLKDQ